MPTRDPELPGQPSPSERPCAQLDATTRREASSTAHTRRSRQHLPKRKPKRFPSPRQPRKVAGAPTSTNSGV